MPSELVRSLLFQEESWALHLCGWDVHKIHLKYRQGHYSEVIIPTDSSRQTFGCLPIDKSSNPLKKTKPPTAQLDHWAKTSFLQLNSQLLFHYWKLMYSQGRGALGWPPDQNPSPHLNLLQLQLNSICNTPYDSPQHCSHMPERRLHFS